MKRSRLSVVAIAATTVLAAACSSTTSGVSASGNSSSPATTSAGAAQSSATGGESTATAGGASGGGSGGSVQALVQQATQVPTWDQYKPSQPPPSFKKGMKIAVINANAKSAAAALQVKGVKDAASAVGWTVQTFDGQGTNTGKITAFRNALAQHFDGIVLVAVDQRIVSDPMQQAAAAGIPVVSTMAGNQAGTSPTTVFADLGGQDLRDGKVVGGWIQSDAAKNSAKANILEFEYPINGTVQNRDKGFSQVVSGCSNCKVLANVQYTSADLGKLSTDVLAAVQAHQNVNYIMIDIGAYASYVVQAIHQLGGNFAKNIKLISYDCVGDQVARIRAGDVEAACDGQASVYSGWGAIDELNRAMNKQPALVEHVPEMLVTKDTPQSATDSSGFNGGFDFASSWKSFWGVS